MTSAPSALVRAYRWHRPLMILAGASLVLFVVCLVGIFADDRILTGNAIWMKPAKFAISIAIYSVTLAWLLSLLTRGRRLASVLGTISAVMLAGELIAIVGQVVRGHTSHFDFATTFDAVVYQAMAVMIGTLWLSNLAIVVLLLMQQLPDRSLTWALRLGMAIAVVGMGLAYLMTFPTTAQVDSWNGGSPATVVGAHTVGLPDGGPGLPIVGWSTVGGDLRIPHFVGIHALQVLVLLALVLVVVGRRVPLLADETIRLRLVVIAAGGYVGMLAIVTWQALRGQSIVHPDVLTAGATAALVIGVLVALGLALRRPNRSGADREHADVQVARATTAHSGSPR